MALASRHDRSGGSPAGCGGSSLVRSRDSSLARRHLAFTATRWATPKSQLPSDCRLLMASPLLSRTTKVAWNASSTSDSCRSTWRQALRTVGPWRRTMVAKAPESRLARNACNNSASGTSATDTRRCPRMRLSGAVAIPRPRENRLLSWCAVPAGAARKNRLLHVNRQSIVFELQNRERRGRPEHRADPVARPAPIGRLVLLQVVEHPLPELTPPQALCVRGRGEELFEPGLAEDVRGLGEVVVLVLVVRLPALAERDVPEAELDPPPGVVRRVVAGAECACHSRGGDGRARLSRPAVLVADAAVGVRALLQVLHRLVGHRLWDRDARVPGRPQALELRDRHRTLVPVPVLRSGHVSPPAHRCLGLAGELDRLDQDPLQLRAPLCVVLLAVHAGEEEQGVAVPVHVVVGLGRVVRVAQEAVRLRAPHEPLDRLLDARAVAAFAEGAPFQEEAHAGQGGHAGRVLPTVGRPVTIPFVLVAGQPVEPATDALLHVRARPVGPGGWNFEHDRGNQGADVELHGGLRGGSKG